MDIALSIKFLSGKYDPDFRRSKTLDKIERARINKPKTTIVRRNLDLIIRENEDVEEVKYRRRTAAEMLDGETIDSPLGIRGITKNKYDGRWAVRVRNGKKQYHVGVFEKLEDAVKARDKVYYAVQNGEFVHDNTYHTRLRQNRSERGLPPNVYHAVNDRYSGKIMIKGAMYFLGTFDTIEEAQAAVNSHKEKINGK